MKKIIALILAGGKGERLYPLTRDRAKPAVPFGGIYRNIDFTLSNCINSGLRHLYVLSQYKSLSLSRHIQLGWNIVSSTLSEYVTAGQLPPKGTVLSPSKAACDVCPRKDSKPDKIEIAAIKRITTSIPDPEKCFLAQGYVCMGPATRSGCGERCVHGNMPCRGCFGPPDGVYDQGAKLLSAFASLLTAKTDAEIDALIDQIPDPAGTFYRFSLPTSIMQRKRIRD